MERIESTSADGSTESAILRPAQGRTHPDLRGRLAARRELMTLADLCAILRYRSGGANQLQLESGPCVSYDCPDCAEDA